MLGARIAALRRSAGMSQAELADRLKISPSAVGMYEQGRREPSGDMLVQIARVFQVSTDFLLTGQSGSPADDAAAAQALENALSRVEQRLQKREGQPFSRQELALILAALLTGS